jgi:hypothetical protein
MRHKGQGEEKGGTEKESCAKESSGKAKVCP